MPGRHGRGRADPAARAVGARRAAGWTRRSPGAVRGGRLPQPPRRTGSTSPPSSAHGLAARRLDGGVRRRVRHRRAPRTAARSPPTGSPSRSWPAACATRTRGRTQALFARIGRDGLLVSEFPPDATPQRHRFLVRNRLIAGLTAGTVVVEAGVRSGALGHRPAGAADGPRRDGRARAGDVGTSRPACTRCCAPSPEVDAGDPDRRGGRGGRRDRRRPGRRGRRRRSTRATAGAAGPAGAGRAADGRASPRRTGSRWPAGCRRWTCCAACPRWRCRASSRRPRRLAATAPARRPWAGRRRGQSS